jgi:DNA transposition AAA+ family ATPase
MKTIETEEFLFTKEYRRFEEFCNACRRDRYIGICHGQPGVGKTLSARQYAQVDLLNQFDYHLPDDALVRKLADCRTVFYTPSVSNTPKSIEKELDKVLYELKELVWTVVPEGERPIDFCELIVVDEADRLKLNSLETLRDLYDRGTFALILVGMPGLEKRLARYPQLYSRVGFSHTFRHLNQDEMRFILEHHWQRLGKGLSLDQFTDHEAVAAICKMTNGNFRLIHRLMAQIQRIMGINGLTIITAEVVEAARQCLVIGHT